jgi:hypothetical protein
MTPEAARELKPRRLCELLADSARNHERAAQRAEWTRLLGVLDRSSPPGPGPRPALALRSITADLSSGVRIQRLLLQRDTGIVLPTLLLLPPGDPGGVVIAVAQGGKAGFLKHRSHQIAAILHGGVAVCLPDLRGIGETCEDSGRGRRGAATARSSTELMLGGTMVGERLRELLSVREYLGGRPDLRHGPMAIWGDSFAPVNPPNREFRVPRGVSDRPKQSEPLGGMLALLAALYEPDIRAVHVHGGLVGFRSVLQSPFVQIPHDVVVPGALTAGDLGGVAATIDPKRLRMDGLVDALNRRVRDGSPSSATEWLVDQLRR